ncbi:MAG TPA: PEGA domain-containing protein, partial [Patescibacteria group bacterium]|nr:PEGA domain-containing protein [Patescibacteria group bacterium]
KVYLDGEYLGETPLCLCESSEMVSVGNYTLRLVPTKNDLSEFQEKITISESVLTVIDRKFAKDSLSEGYYISLTPLEDETASELVVVSLPEGATVFLDAIDIGKSPLSYKDPTESDHVLRIQKNGYKEKSIRIRTPLGYKLTAAAYLSTVESLFGGASLTASASAENDILPTPASGKTVVILDTPTGFLRVRDSINGAEIGQVSPGDVYEYLDEQQGWIQIKLKDGTSGWISGEYTEKQN